MIQKEDKKVNLNDSAIQIRILKALEDVKPFGPYKHFYLVRVLNNLKSPNILTGDIFWKYLKDELNLVEEDNLENKKFESESMTFDEIIFKN